MVLSSKAVLGLLASLALVVAEEYVCPEGKSSTSISVGAEEAFSFFTQDGDQYTSNVNCQVKYEMDATCKQLLFDCEEFNLGKGDMLGVSVQTKKGVKTRRFRKKKFKVQKSNGDITVQFKSNKKKNGAGAVCFVECSKAASGVTTTSGPGSSSASTEAPTTTTGVDQCPGCTLQTYWGSENTLDYIIRDIFVVWWDKKFDHSMEADVMVNTLISIRRDCLDNLEMMDPPNPAAGHYYNVYLHHSGQDGDSLPDGWGMGQGTDPYGLPFLTIGYQGYKSNTVVHEGFHIFQYSATSPGFAYSGDSMWYIESSAQWYATLENSQDRNQFVEAGAIIANPQLALWHSFQNHGPDDPASNAGRPGWMYGVRQYGLHTLLWYLTSVKGVNRDILTSGFYANTDLSPQEYFYSNIGASLFRSHFADWAAHNTAEMDYLTRAQYERGLLEITLAGDWDYYRPSVWSGDSEGTGGQWVRPPADLTARGWAYNVFNVTNTEAATYNFELQGDAQGSQGASSYFVGRVVVMGNKNKFYNMEMSSALNGQASVVVKSSDSQIMLVIASVPEFFGSWQTYGYQVKITRN